MSGAMAAITAVFTVIALLLEAWAQAAPKRKEEDRHEMAQRGRRDLQDGNADAVAVRIDSLLDPQISPASGSHAGSEGNVPEGGADSTARRLASLGISIIEVAGEGRKL